ncbi:MAG: hypothetical protein PHW93_04020 [Candidatus Methanomethylophilaceae archaeon]|nr:hypothetical protein [Candidatus Methanomethylophilaceae archaeon]
MPNTGRGPLDPASLPRPSTFSGVEAKLKKGNRLLFDRHSQVLEGLVTLMDSQDRRTLVAWALDCAQHPLQEFEARYPSEARPRRCLELCRDWAQGKVKMPVAKRAILDCHAVAQDLRNPEHEALCHAIAQGASTVHVRGHALGLPIYELTAIVIRLGGQDYQGAVQEKADWYLERLRYWESHVDDLGWRWAPFLLKRE